MHGRRLFVVRALHVFVSDREYALHFADPYPTSIFDADQFLERGPPLVSIGKLQQQGDLPVAAVGNQRIVSVEFALNAVAFEGPLGAQHLEDLIAYRRVILETPSHVGPDLHIAYSL